MVGPCITPLRVSLRGADPGPEGYRILENLPGPGIGQRTAAAESQRIGVGWSLAGHNQNWLGLGLSHKLQA